MIPAENIVLYIIILDMNIYSYFFLFLAKTWNKFNDNHQTINFSAPFLMNKDKDASSEDFRVHLITTKTVVIIITLIIMEVIKTNLTNL